MSDLSEFHPILSLGIGAVTDADREAIKAAFAAFERDNPGIRVKLEAADGRLLLLGEDELQLEAVCQRIFPNDSLEVGELQILYRETIRRPAEAEGRYIRQTGGKGNYGHCWLRIEPNERGMGYEFASLVSNNIVPAEYVYAVDRGAQLALKMGILAGFPIVDVKVTLFSGSYHDIDSNEMAFVLAGSTSLKEATRKALPVVLEPVMTVEAQVPGDLSTAAVRDIQARRGRIVSIGEQAGSATIYALVPLAELLRSSARGRPRYAMRFAGYEMDQGGSNGDEAVAY